MIGRIIGPRRRQTCLLQPPWAVAAMMEVLGARIEEVKCRLSQPFVVAFQLSNNNCVPRPPSRRLSLQAPGLNTPITLDICRASHPGPKKGPPLISLTESPKRALFAFWRLPRSYLRAAYALSLSKMALRSTLSASSQLQAKTLTVHLSNHPCCRARCSLSPVTILSRGP